MPLKKKHKILISDQDIHNLHHPIEAIKHADIALSLSWRRQLLRFIGDATVLFIAVNFLLVAVSQNRLPVGAKLFNDGASLMNRHAAAELVVERMSQTQVELAINDDSKHFAIQELGLHPEASIIIDSYTTGKGLHRVPLLNSIRLATSPSDLPLFIDVDRQQLNNKLGEIVQAEFKPAANASLSLENISGILKPVIVPEQVGYEVSADIVKAQLISGLNSPTSGPVQINLRPIQPDITKQDLEPEVTKAQQLVSKDAVLSTPNGDFVVSSATLRAFLKVDTDSTTGKPYVDIDLSKLTSYVANHVAPGLYVPSQPSASSYVDGILASSSEGQTGRALNSEQTAKNLLNSLTSASPSAQAIMQEIAPKTNVSNSYSKTNHGLKMLIDNFAKNNPGSYYVSLEGLSGAAAGLSAELNGNQGIVPASVYKIFLAFATLKRAELGQLDLNADIGGKTPLDCVHRIIHTSDNPCGADLLNYIGWAEVDSTLAQSGLYSTKLNNTAGGNMSTTTADTLKLFRGLYSSQLLNQANSQHLIGLMNGQIWKTGIPSGSGGNTVSNKVGRLGAWSNDVGIVWAPGNNYALSIFTSSSSFSNIKKLSQEIYNVMSQ